jgi:hypothetical protein
MAVAATVAAVGVVLWLIGLVVRYTSIGAMAAMVDEVETRGATSFAAGLNKGWRRFPRLLAIELLLGLASFFAVLAILLVLGALGALLAIPGIAMVAVGEGARAIGIICLVAAAALFTCLFAIASLALGAVLTVVSAWASRACILGMQGVFESIGTGFGLLRRHAGASLSVWLVMALTRLCIGLLAVPVVLIVLGLAGGLGMALWQATRESAAVTACGVLALLTMGIVGGLLGGIYSAFISAYWTLAYRAVGSLAERT